MSLTQAVTQELDITSFRKIAELAYTESGIVLPDEKHSLIQSRLRHRLTELKIKNFDCYANFVLSDAGRSERSHMISALTTNVSHFFREQHHFDLLSKDIVARILPELRNGGKLRIWSAGCSNGQEALSIAITLQEKIPNIANLDIRILATDIDPTVISFARIGKYPERLVSGLPKPVLNQYFTAVTESSEVFYVPNSALTDLIRYNELNLLRHWPMKGLFDIIFCRNVVIYFDQVTQVRLWKRFSELLRPSGTLLLGHSERIIDPKIHNFLPSGPTRYQRL